MPRTVVFTVSSPSVHPVLQRTSCDPPDGFLPTYQKGSWCWRDDIASMPYPFSMEGSGNLLPDPEGSRNWTKKGQVGGAVLLLVAVHQER